MSEEKVSAAKFKQLEAQLEQMRAMVTPGPAFPAVAVHKLDGPHSLIDPKSGKRVSFDKATAHSEAELHELLKEGWQKGHPLEIEAK